jgi:internalin A
MSVEHLSGFLKWLEGLQATESLAFVPDHQLLESFLTTRDEVALRVLISRHGPMVYRVCRRVLSDEQDAEDAFQVAFLVFVRKAGSIRKTKSLASWLHGVAYNVALRVRTSSQRRLIREKESGVRDAAIEADDWSWKDVRAILDEELARLPENLRAPLVLCYLEGLTQDEAAKQLGQTKSTMRRYLKHGRALLGASLTQRGLALPGALMGILFSECVVAMPPRLAVSAATLGEAVRTGKSTALSHTLNTLTDEVIKTMFRHNLLNLKWIFVALLGMGLGTAALGSLFTDGQSHESPVASKSEDIEEPVRKTPASDVYQGPANSAVEDNRTMSPEVIRAWLKGGAEFGHFSTDESGFMAFRSRQAKNGELAGFNVSQKKLAGLPAPDVPFGLLWMYPYVDLKELAAFSQLQMLLLGADEVKNLKELAAFKQLHTLSLRGEYGSITDAAMKELAALKQLQALYLDRPNMTDVGLEELASLKQLRTLKLNYARVTDHGLKELAALTQLQTLDLYGTSVTDVGLQVVASLSQLQSLNLGNTEVTDAGLKELAILRQLHSLNLGYTKVGDAGLKELASLKELQTLELSRTKVTDAGLKELTALKQLRTLKLNSVPVTDKSLKDLAALKQLQTLDLFETNVSDAGVKDLSGLKLRELILPVSARTNLGLKNYLAVTEPPLELDLYGWQNITDATLREVSTLKELQKLDLSYTQVTDVGMKELLALKKLQTLTLSHTNVTDAGVKELAALKQLRELYLGHMKVGDVGVKELAALTQLQTLDLSHTNATDVGVKELAALKQLRWLRLDDTEVSDVGVKELAALEELELLDLHGTNVTDASLKILATLKKLNSLDLDSTQVTTAGVEELRRALPACRITRK